MLILIDLDGVLADFEHGFYEAWQTSAHGHEVIPLEDRRSFYIRDDYPRHLRQALEAIYTAPGFYRSLPPMTGAIESINKLLVLGHEARIRTPTWRHIFFDQPYNRHVQGDRMTWVSWRIHIAL